MKITFTKLRLTNFKGIESFETEFSNDTIVKGDNGTGKSTLFDAMLWCLFGKNSQNDTKFSIKNTVKTELNRADHIVELTMMVDGEPVTAKRVYREVWTKRRGSEETEFTGHETLYFWNNVPCSQKEYQVKVSEIAEEQLFKLLTNPLYFNVTLSETQRRDTLVKMAGEISNEKIIGGTPAYVELFAKLKGQKTLDEYKKEVAYSKSGLKKQLSDIPARIDELIKSNPTSENWGEIEKEITEKQASIKKIDKEISSLSATFEKSNREATRIHNEVLQAGREMSRIEMKLRGESDNIASRANMGINNAKFELTQVKNSIERLKRDKESYLHDKQVQLEAIEEKRKEWISVNEGTIDFSDTSFCCPTCKRQLNDSDIEKTKAELSARFNEGKQVELAKLHKSGTELRNTIDYVEKSIIEIEDQIKELEAKESELLVTSSQPPQQPTPINLEDSEEYQKWKKVSEQKVTQVETVDISEQNGMKEAIQEGIDALRKALSSKEVIEKNNARIEELKADEKRYSKELTDLEKIEFTIDSFQKKRMEVVEQAVNDKFKLVKFKLFRTLVNGGEEPCCITTLNNVEFSDLNHAGQVNAGIDIINALSGFYGVSVPIIFDNAESTNVFQKTDAQMIRLYVTSDKELTIA